MSRNLLPSSLTLLAALSVAATLSSCGMKHELDYEEPVGSPEPEVDQTSVSTDGANAGEGEAAERQTATRTEGNEKKEDSKSKDLGGGRAQVPAEVTAPSAPVDAPAAEPMLVADLDDAVDFEEVISTRETSRLDRRAEAKPAKQLAQSAPMARGPVGAAGALTGSTPTGMPYQPPMTTVAPPPPMPDAANSSETYTDHGVNDFTMVDEDALSTFSIDVDTASYTVARRKLQEGALPPQAAVRVEEFVNYFDYDYVTPKNDPFAVNMEAMPDPFRPGHHILRVGVQGKEVSQEDRPALHLTFLADVSGSMTSSDKLPLAKQSLHMLVDSMQEGDTVALATYAGRVAKILEPTDVTDKATIHAAIESLSSGGSTAMSSGIDLAYEMAWQSFEPGAENRVVVMSDGDANVGRTSWDDMLSQIKGYADRGVTLTTVGFGMGNYKDTLMEQLANKGDGNNFYIDSRSQAQRVFVEEMGSAMITIARDVKIQVEFNDESVMAYRLIGYENRDIADVDFRNDRVDAGEVGSGHNVTALYDVILRDGYDRELAKVRMRYEAPGADKAATEKVWTFQASRLKETSSLASRDTRIAYTAATFAEVLRGSPHAAEIDLGALAAFGQKSARSGEKDDRELIELIKTADRLGADDFDAAVSTR